MNKLYNTQKNLASDLAKFFKKVSNVTKPQLKIIPYIILGMIEAESVVTADIVKKLKGNFLKVFPASTTRRLERFFNNPKFNVYKFYDEIIREVINIIVNTKMYNLGKIFLYKNVHFYFVLFIQLYILLNYMKIMSYQLNL